MALILGVMMLSEEVKIEILKELERRIDNVFDRLFKKWKDNSWADF